MNRILCFALLIASLCDGGFSSAATIPTVYVGNPGNAGDVQSNGTYGSVAVDYRIGRTEVSNAHYAEFLNGVDPTGANSLALYDNSMSSFDIGGINFNAAATGAKYEVKTGRENNPVVSVSWYDSIRFANWLHNGQGNGDTESGAYTLLGGTPTPSNGLSITRNSGARWWLPSEDEWYKAAYHKNDGVTGNYWDYPTSTDAEPFSDQPPGNEAPTPSNAANFRKTDLDDNGYNDGYAVTGLGGFPQNVNYLTDVGAYTAAASPYGTFDQAGNTFEWNETVDLSLFRGLRGGSWFDLGSFLGATKRASNNASFQDVGVGFRVASLAVPEPTAFTLLCLGSICLLRRYPSHTVR